MAKKKKPTVEDYVRPHGTTSNPMWYLAPSAEEMVPTTSDPFKEGERMVRLCGQFILTQGNMAGLNLGDVMVPWQPDTIRYIFGERNEKGEKIVRRAMLKLGKGSGKTVVVSSIALAVVMDCAIRKKHYRSLIVIVAASLASAQIAFDHITEAIYIDPELKPQFHAQTQFKQIKHIGSGIVIRVLAPNMKSAVGIRPLITIIDELHLAALEAKDFGRIMDQLRRGSANYGTDALELIISTSPPDRAAGIYKDTLAYARKVRDGKIIDPSFLPVLYEWPVKERPELKLDEPEEWWRGVPSLGYTMDPTEMQLELDKAQSSEGSSEELGLFLSQRLGIEPDDRAELAGGETLLRVNWKHIPTRSRTIPEGVANLVVAIDAGGADDPMAVVYLWEDDQGDFQIVVNQYLTKTGYDRADEHLRKVYQKAIAEGEMFTYTTFKEMDNAIVKSILQIMDTAENMPAIGGDQYGRTGIATYMTNETGLKFQAIPQGWKLASPLATIESWMVDGKVKITKGPLVDFNVDNLVVEEQNGILRFRKADSSLHASLGSLKIDGIMAILTAIALRTLTKTDSDAVASIDGLVG